MVRIVDRLLIRTKLDDRLLRFESIRAFEMVFLPVDRIVIR
jgi:hypothetical protein